jgi:hypothetical protein
VIVPAAAAPVSRFSAIDTPASTPPELKVAVVSGVCDPCEPAPVIIAVLVSEAAEVTHVAQAIVPVVVIVPPVIGEVVAIDVTPPPLYWGMLSTPPVRVAAPLVPVVVRDENIWVCHPCAVATEFMPQTWFAVPFVLMLAARFDVQLVQVPVRLVMTPDVGVPKIGATKVCCPVQAFA